MQNRLRLSIVITTIGAGLLVAAAFAGSSNTAPQGKSSPAKVGGTLRVNISTTDIQFSDPSLDYEVLGWQVEYATALKLLNWRETKAILFPEAAAAFPRVASGGRKYTFTIRKGLRLSNGEKVTAANFKYAFLRAASPKMNSQAAAFLQDLGSVQTKGKYTLVINLKKPRPDFVSIVSMPFFQAISLKLPMDPGGVKLSPSGGPYYMASRDIGRSFLLKRNPYYKGNRPHNPSQMAFSVNTDLDTSLLQVEKNQRDYDGFGVPPTAHVHLHSTYPKRYHVNPGIITDFLSMNTTYGSAGEGIKGHSCFNGYKGLGPRTRKAVNYVVNRPATLAARGAFAGTTTDQILPPNMPGFHQWKIYPTGKPNVAKAKALKPKKCNIVFYGATSPTGLAIMQLVQSELKQIGIKATLKTFPFAVRIQKEGHRGEPYDLDLQAWGSDYPDPVDFIDVLLDGRNIQAENNNNNAYFNNPKFNKQMQDAGRITRLSKRYSSWANIDRDVMRDQAPLAPLFFRTVREFTSNRVGCYTYQPVYAAMALEAVCIK